MRTRRRTARRRNDEEEERGTRKRRRVVGGGGARTFGVVGAHLSTLSAPAALSFPPSVHRPPLSLFLPRFLSARLVLAPGQRPTFVCAHEKKARSRRGLKRDRDSLASTREREKERRRTRERERERDVTRSTEEGGDVCARAFALARGLREAKHGRESAKAYYGHTER